MTPTLTVGDTIERMPGRSSILGWATSTENNRVSMTAVCRAFARDPATQPVLLGNGAAHRS